ncbi:GNAT family N-acetyltransferase [Acinetobacter radioresistens]|uniref:GNAT family N-acetyltransferase n=1 Tax=Acinetobacter radioresistens TaxID=40216 RepID=UPI003213A0DB
MNFRIKKYSESDRNIWNDFLLTCKNYHFMFNRDFIEYHSDRFKDHSLIILDEKDKIVALLPGNLTDRTFYTHQGLTFGGFLINKNIHASDLLEIFEILKLYLKEEGIEKIIYKCIPTIYHQYPAQEDLYVLFINNAKLYRRDISSSINIEDGFKYSKGRKWGINKAKKEGVICKLLDHPSEVWSLIREVLSEHYNTTPVHTETEIDYLKQKFPNNIKVYAAFLNEIIISAAITFETDQVVHTQYLASGKTGRDICALDLLIDFIISESKKYAKIFDFGISNENNGRYLNNGLISQKESFGARAIVHDFYSVDII